MSGPGRGYILRVSRSDSPGGYVLVSVTSNGPKALDLVLLATEGENPYAGEVKHSQCFKLKDRKSVQDDETWEATLRSMLLQKVPGQAASPLSIDESLECAASISGPRLAIVIRKKTSGITQRLGEITLHENQSLELDLVSWAGIAVQRGDSLEQELRSLKSNFESQRNLNASLNKQLEDLVVAKKEHEDILLVKFQSLLNSKKLKIRDQQRLLARGASHPPQAKPANRANNVKSSALRRERKRKAQISSPESGDDDAFESMGRSEVKDDASAGIEATPQATDEEVTEDEDEDEDESPQARNEPVTVSRDEQVTDQPPSKLNLDDLPPARSLPFQQTKVETVKGASHAAADSNGTQQSPTMQQQDENDEDEATTDDDEL